MIKLTGGIVEKIIVVVFDAVHAARRRLDVGALGPVAGGDGDLAVTRGETIESRSCRHRRTVQRRWLLDSVPMMLLTLLLLRIKKKIFFFSLRPCRLSLNDYLMLWGGCCEQRAAPTRKALVSSWRRQRRRRGLSVLHGSQLCILGNNKAEGVADRRAIRPSN